MASFASSATTCGARKHAWTNSRRHAWGTKFNRVRNQEAKVNLGLSVWQRVKSKLDGEEPKWTPKLPEEPKGIILMSVYMEYHLIYQNIYSSIPLQKTWYWKPLLDGILIQQKMNKIFQGGYICSIHVNND